MGDQLTVKDIKGLSLGELYKKVKLPKELLEIVTKQGKEDFERIIKETYKLPYPDLDEKGEIIPNNESEDIYREKLLGNYRDIIDVLKEFCDLNPRYYPIIALWILGTYYHESFPSYPYLYFNAMKGSGKSRTLRLITYLSKDGCMLNSLTEAVLFRTKGTLAIDEFEGITRKGSEALKELLNSAYKKGITIKRMKKVKTLQGEEQVVEEFNVYRPILLANINGLDDVLGDRCITIILDKSNNPRITRKIEMYEHHSPIQRIKAFPYKECRLCRVDVPVGVYMGWNIYIDTNNTILTNTNNNTNNTLYEKINNIEIEGRNLELALPLFIMANEIGEEVLDEVLIIFKEIIEEKRKEDFVESLDIALTTFVSQEPEGKWISIKDLFNGFKSYVQVDELWFNEKWLGRALKRLNLAKEKKRMNYGRLVLLDIIKAQEKVRMFK